MTPLTEVADLTGRQVSLQGSEFDVVTSIGPKVERYN